MRHLYRLLAIGIIAILFACSPSYNENGLLTIDVTKKYPKIELNLKDLADIKYIKLKEDPDCLIRTRVLFFGDKYIVVEGEKEELLIYDHNGDLVNTIFQVGSGPHEYLYASNLYLDEEKEELFVHDRFIRKYFVYTFDGDFIRGGTAGTESNVYSLNKNEFICHNRVTEKTPKAFTTFGV